MVAAPHRHVVLLGDSIFDNAVYVPGEPAVIEQLRDRLPSGWSATLLAVDGDRIRDVPRQLNRLPFTASHLFLSVGGNDALDDAGILDHAQSAQQLQFELQEAVAQFASAYAEMLDVVLSRKLPLTVCTVYDQCPFADALWRELVPWALAEYNAGIIREASARGVGVIELREICTQASDYSALSPIEPSSQGGMKIVQAILHTLGL